MDDEPEVIRQQMEVTRSDLTQKLEALETKVVNTVENTTCAVTDTVTSVKEAVALVLRCMECPPPSKRLSLTLRAAPKLMPARLKPIQRAECSPRRYSRARQRYRP